MWRGVGRWVRRRRAPFWIALAIATVSFLAIFTSDPYTDYAPAARWGNALGAAAVFGILPCSIWWLAQYRVRSRQSKSPHTLDSSNSSNTLPVGQKSSSLVPEIANFLGSLISRRAPILHAKHPPFSRAATSHSPHTHYSQLQMDLGAYQLHPWIFYAASSLWQGGHYRQAVEQAARAVSGNTQKKVRRFDVSDDTLLQNLFSEDDPKRDAPRL